MNDLPEPIDPEIGNGKTIPEQLEAIRKAPFKFNCLGINCLGWIIIMAVVLAVYLFKK